MTQKRGRYQCISMARNLRTPVSRLRNQQGGFEAYNIHNQTDKVEFLDVGQLPVEEKVEHIYPLLLG